MRAVKVLLFAALVAGWWQMWTHHEFVASAYTDERAPLTLELKGVGAVPVATERAISPYALVPPGSERAVTVAPAVEADSAEAMADPELTGGSVTLEGVVQLPDGTPVAGATIRIERFTVAGSAVGETVSGPDGTWQADGLLAGRLRVRAYAPNALATVESVVVVLSTAGRATIPLQVQAAAPSIQFDVAGPLGLAVGTNGTVAVVVSRELVDEEGRLVEIPLAGQPLLTTFSTPVRLLSADLVTTDEGGAARYLLTCDGVGTAVARPELDGERPTIQLPPCLTAEALAEREAAAAEAAGEAESVPIGDDQGAESRDDGVDP